MKLRSLWRGCTGWTLESPTKATFKLSGVTKSTVSFPKLSLTTKYETSLQNADVVLQTLTKEIQPIGTTANTYTHSTNEQTHTNTLHKQTQTSPLTPSFSPLSFSSYPPSPSLFSLTHIQKQWEQIIQSMVLIIFSQSQKKKLAVRSLFSTS